MTERDKVQQVPGVLQEDYEDIPNEVITLLWDVFSRRNEHEKAKEFEEQMMSRSI
ncbi:hypothetical protein ACKE5C_18955 (plasmid) [Aneurinibacillus thermoaerophilus]|uniref:Uncharacterized protein n=1 Tax=Aneurinibacillus thermoaerophilus TaxID=143495 RepID=A0ABX8YFY7_ANETH|nr:hypothetical protein [Aneurinibacillus thermoaerophilus]QYY44723.1 hypothetical protein K3F53_18945 [Aneurinibacillus thermoaerophilus]